jgi:hypothetical protein
MTTIDSLLPAVSLAPVGSLPPRSSHVAKATLSVTIEPVWPTIRQIRKTVGEALQDAAPGVRTGAMMTASELTENAIKYGESVGTQPAIYFRFEVFAEQIRIQVANGSTSVADVQRLLDCIEKISTATDKEALYLERVHQLLENQQESGRLGLYRIALEGRFELYASYDSGVVTVVATRNLP